MKKIFSILGIVIIFTSIYIITFHLPTRNLIPIYTYYGIVSLLVITIVLGVILFILHKLKYKYFDIKDCIIILLLCFFINLSIFCTIPITLERSISVFMLNYISDDKEYTKEEIEDIFIKKYVYEYDAFEKRFEEQLYTGTIENDNNTYEISEKGKFLVDCFWFIKKIYNVKGEVLN